MNPDLAPMLFRDFQIEPEEARSILRPQKDERLGFGFSLNPYRGCSHGCRYCYVRDYPAQIAGQSKGTLHEVADWGRWMAPKVNAPELLWSQRHKLHHKTVFMASATDPYQPLEREYRLTRKCLQVLLQCPTTKLVLHTRAPLILQDLELIKAFGERISVGFSIPTDDDSVRQIVEPDAPPIPTRWATVEKLSKAGIRVGIAAAPLMPVHDVAAFARRAKQSGARSAWVGGLRLISKDPFYQLLASQQWLHILDPSYPEPLRDALREAFPKTDRKTFRRGPKRENLDFIKLPKSPPRQPGLFDALI
jgi:DNA repair photolyase